MGAAKELKEESLEELVEYTAPYDYSGNNSGSIFAAVNGETIRIRRGETVRIKRKFLKVLQDADRQERASMDTVRKLSKQ